jgi:hypothetical protein
MTMPETPTLDELQQRFADAVSSERESFWRGAEIAQYAASSQPTAKARAKVINALASTGHCTSSRVRELIRLVDSFGSEARYPDVALVLFRACITAAKRLGTTAVEVLDDALAKGWHAADVSKLGRPAKLVGLLEATCRRCTAEVRVRVTNATRASALAGHGVVCPLCAEPAADGATTLGTLGLDDGTEDAAA